MQPGSHLLTTLCEGKRSQLQHSFFFFFLFTKQNSVQHLSHQLHPDTVMTNHFALVSVWPNSLNTPALASFYYGTVYVFILHYIWYNVFAKHAHCILLFLYYIIVLYILKCVCVFGFDSFRLLVASCSYYELDDVNHETVNRYLSNLVERSLRDLGCSYCIEIKEVGFSDFCFVCLFTFLKNNVF